MQSQKGFTLIELLLVICVTGILLLMAIGPIGRVYNRFQLGSAAASNRQMLYNAMTSSHLYDNVIVCFSKDNKHCSGKQEPMIVAFVDLNKNGKRDEDEILLDSLALNNEHIKLAIKSFRKHNNVLIAKAESLATSSFSMKIHSQNQIQHKITGSNAHQLSLNN